MEDIKITFDAKYNRRLLGNTEVVIHCHHYNCQLQSSIESSQYLDGPRLIKDAAYTVFGKEFQNYLQHRTSNTPEDKWQLALQLYKIHGFGNFDWKNWQQQQITASSSHFAEGWKAKFGNSEDAKCSLSCGFLEAVHQAITDETVQIDERLCIAKGDKECLFESTKTTRCIETTEPKPHGFTPSLKDPDVIQSPNIAETEIIEAIASIPVYGDEQGLIPMFGIYATNIPAEYYNRISFSFEAQMAKEGKDLEESARSLLIFGGEVCGLHTFHGIMASQEWESLVFPMIKNREDNIFALIAITNAFGWGNWYITELVPGKKLVLRSYNGYEALGYLSMYSPSEVPRCYMLTGVSAGLMELIYSPGTLEEKFGLFQSRETKCITKGDPYCEFVTERV